MENIELNKYDNDKKNKRRRIILTSIISILVLTVVGLTSCLIYKDKKYKQLLENQYNKTFYELVGYVENVETNLAKSLVTNSSEYSAQNLVNVWRESNLAQSAMDKMPINVHELESANKLLNQISDYSYTLTKSCIYNNDISEEQMNNLTNLYQHSTQLKKELSDLSSQINAGTFAWNKISKYGAQTLDKEGNVADASITENINNNLQEYSGLIYDGAFSDHITQMTPLGLTGNDINEEEAKNTIYKFIDEATVKEITLDSNTNSELDCYNFNVLLKDKDQDEEQMYICITKKGGHILYMVYDRNYETPTLSIDNAKVKAKEYLNKIGFENMQETYYMNDYNSVTINYAYKENGVLMYPDLIKVKVALDNGEIIGIESKGYLYNNHQRKNLTPTISIEEARRKINGNVNIIQEQLCIIPTDWKTEILCYEFKGTVEDKTFLIYINAQNGKEENIYILIEDENGMLTI